MKRLILIAAATAACAPAPVRPEPPARVGNCIAMPWEQRTVRQGIYVKHEVEICLYEDGSLSWQRGRMLR